MLLAEKWDLPISEEALKPFRDKVKIGTKFGFAIEGKVGLNSCPDHFEKVIEDEMLTH